MKKQNNISEDRIKWLCENVKGWMIYAGLPRHKDCRLILEFIDKDDFLEVGKFEVWGDKEMDKHQKAEIQHLKNFAKECLIYARDAKNIIKI
ncbi:MAG: hypothetical protein ACOZBH_04475 [Patescibacteria group bacterium]